MTTSNNKEFLKKVTSGDRITLARAITLIESNAGHHFQQAQELLNNILPQTGNSVRIGITGVPGAGKSTLIEALGLHIIEKGHKVAVLAVDPSSSRSRGSILGDKTRMEQLSRRDEAFIRPSPSGGALGGVARKTRETILLCEAAGFDVILVETMGVGQGEITVRGMVDFFVLIQIAGAGDELQGIKKGVMELADLVLVNKADGDNREKAIAARRDLRLALHYLSPATPGWETPVQTCSAIRGEGIAELWQTVLDYRGHVEEQGYFNKRREEQAEQWMLELVEEQLRRKILSRPGVAEEIEIVKKKLHAKKINPTMAAQAVLEKIFSR